MAKTNPLKNQWFHFLKHMGDVKGSNPIHVGYKIWVLAEQYGYVIQFDSCHGAKPGKQIASKTRSELGEMVVLCLMNNLPRVHGQLFYFISVTSACWGV